MKTYAFIDASNLFYGGEKSLGWKIDYQKLIKYLKGKYSVSKIFYFGGIETHGYKYDYLGNDCVPVKEIRVWLEKMVKKEGKKWDEARLILFSKHLQRIKFYLKLQEFGFDLFLKPVKLYYQPDGSTQRKANCDEEKAFYLMDHQNEKITVYSLEARQMFMEFFFFSKADPRLAQSTLSQEDNIRADITVGNFRFFEGCLNPGQDKIDHKVIVHTHCVPLDLELADQVIRTRDGDNRVKWAIFTPK